MGDRCSIVVFCNDAAKEAILAATHVEETTKLAFLNGDATWRLRDSEAEYAWADQLAEAARQPGAVLVGFHGDGEEYKRCYFVGAKKRLRYHQTSDQSNLAVEVDLEWECGKVLKASVDLTYTKTFLRLWGEVCAKLGIDSRRVYEEPQLL